MTPLPASARRRARRERRCCWARPRAPAARRESAAAREQARLCERKNLEEGAAACRQALALGIGPQRRGPVRAILARHLVSLERWEELAEVLREDVRESPTSAAAWQRLGLTLLFALDEPAEAIGALEEAVRLAPSDAAARVGLGLALHAAGRAQEARASLEEALRLEPSVLDGRPGGARRARGDPPRRALALRAEGGPLDPKPRDRVASRAARRGLRPALVARHEPARQPARDDRGGGLPPPGAGRGTTPGRSPCTRPTGSTPRGGG